MKNLKLFYAAAMIALMSVSCVKDEKLDGGPSQYDGKTIELSFRYKIAAEASEDGTEIPFVKAPGDVSESEVFNVWVFQFDSESLSGKLVGAPHYVDLTASDPVVPLVESNGSTHRLVYVVNINDEYFNWNMSGTSTYQNLLDKYRVIMGEEQLYGYSEKNLPMSGTESGIIDATTTLCPTLYRSVARLQLNLSVNRDANNTAAGFKVMSVQLCNIPERMDLADRLIQHMSNEIYPESSGYLNYAAVTSDLPVDDGVPVTFQWYMPRNTQGTVTNDIVTRKTAFAPTTATYFKVIAKNAEGTGVIFRVYPGANMKDDFNIKPNHKYTVNLNIVGLGDSQMDSRVENFGTVTFPATSNCYILNPPLDGMASRTFNIPIARANEYWGGTGPGYGNIGVGGAIQNGDNWVVKLLWQDLGGIVTSNNSSTTAITLLKATGTGASGNNGLFSIKVPATALHGNFLIAVYKADASFNPSSNILWSWHFWVTDYNPDQIVNIRGSQWTYPVPGGRVERYGSNVFGYPASHSSNIGMRTDNDYVYNPAVTTAAPYAQSVMMDRYVGSPHNKYISGSSRGVLYYQFGRKDPLPAPVDLYDINGDKLSAAEWNKATANATTVTENNVKYGVNNPLTFIMTGGNDWSGLNENIYLWLDSKNLVGSNSAADLQNSTGYYAKSFYDPCPLGWKLPFVSVSEDFHKGITTMYPERNLPPWIGEEYGALYWPYAKVGTGYPVLGTIFFSATGYRGSSGSMTLMDVHTKVWTSSIVNTTTANLISFVTQKQTGNTSFSPTGQSEVRVLGCPVRCVKEYRPE